ncbi:metallophosphoesterase [Microcoleus sp. FACHB-68]|uniref:metallophosphoesterase family protein n=1 Tax=Microcoleus sp. FACHB-68 TaxID=2692826 RepID=UPI001689459E|nr:metallophosphoesterase [Microcoleus sp. FACHB-68]MBD1937117.1 metallophosphoesterase [Microcoleus sp. FACHB-68]
MQFVSDPSITVKIRKMNERVRWRHSMIAERSIDQTRMVVDDGKDDSPEFSFLVVGDSGSGRHGSQNPQRQIAEQMALQRDSCRFVLHTGDVIYLVGSSEYYPENFIKPYREFLAGGEHPDRIDYDKMVFNLPFLPVLGNHDYYDLPLVYGVMSLVALPLRRLLRSRLDLDIGLHGSGQGKAYAKAFLDYLQGVNDWELGNHLDRHYTATTETGRCLRYEPGRFTRLPNRYYSFRYGGIDFFALDSNTFNAPPPLPATKEGDAYRRLLEKRRDELDQQQVEIAETSSRLNPNVPDEAEHLDDLRTKLEQLEELTIDINKQLAADATTVTDFEQLDWLKQQLIESWNTEGVRGRVIYFHHPPYVTEATKWQQAQTLTVRRHLRWVLDGVSVVVGDQAQGRPLVDLILNGHAHCLEYLRSDDTGHADSNLNWIVCGGSGYSLRRQREEGPDLMETFWETEGKDLLKVAQSQLFIGRKGHGSKKRRPYSFLRIDVKDGFPPKFIVRPFISERFQRQWTHHESESFEI